MVAGPMQRADDPEIPVVRASCDLTRPQIELLRLICFGMTNKEIAQQLATSVAAVKWRTSQLFEKLQVRNRVQAAVCRGSAIEGMTPPLAAPGPMPEALRDIERRILKELAHGLTNEQIATSLGVTRGTVKWYIRELFGKLQARNRIELLARARERRWL